MINFQIYVKDLDSCYASGYGLHYWNEIPIIGPEIIHEYAMYFQKLYFIFIHLTPFLNRRDFPLQIFVAKAKFKGLPNG